MINSQEVAVVLNCSVVGVNNLEIEEFCVDSRSVSYPESTLFFALKGVNHDGHHYIPELYDRGVRHFVIREGENEFLELEDATFYRVPNVLSALQQLAGWYRKQMQAEVIAITGSNGKTVVKEWLYQLLSEESGIYRSPRSYNSQVGVALSLLGMDSEDRLAIIEAGISLPGEMERLEQMIVPDIGIFTHLGDAHGENFVSWEQKLQEKARLFQCCRYIIGREGEAMEYLLNVVGKEKGILWGESESADIRIVENCLETQGRTIGLYWKGEFYHFYIPFSDEASLENCLNAVSVLLLKGKTPEYVVEKVKKLHPIAMRMEIKEGIHHCVLINDYYNSDAASFQLALKTLAMQDIGRKRVVILSDFVDTGNEEEVLYHQVAELLKKAQVALFIGIGEVISRYSSFFQLPECRFYKNTDAFLHQEDRTHFHDQAILIKGARSFRFEYIAGFLQKQSHTTILEVDLDAMVHNLNYFRSLVPERTKIAVMVKAFAYGSGAVEIARLLQYQGVNYLMVAYVDEGVELRSAGITIPIGVMNPEPEAFDALIEFNLEPEIYSLELLKTFNQSLSRHGIERYPVHLKLNTGMNRSGLDAEELPDLLHFFEAKRNVEIRSAFSHLAGSDDEKHDAYTLMQIEKFVRMTEEIQRHFDYPILRHILNSAGIERFPRHAFDMVRLGIGLHGISAIGTTLQPVSSFKSYIASMRFVVQQDTVGYGRRGRLNQDSMIAVIPVGYADGLNRHLSCGVGEVVIRGKRVPIIGNICMDACMVDVTGVGAKIGDEVEIFGKQIPVTELAEKLETIPYEILTNVSHRVKRVYFKE